MPYSRKSRRKVKTKKIIKWKQHKRIILGKIGVGLIVGLVILFGLFLAGGLSNVNEANIIQNEAGKQSLTINPNSINSDTSNQDLQLRTLQFITPTPAPTITPTPAQACTADNGTQIAPSGASADQISCNCHGVAGGWIIDCENGQGTCINAPEAENSCSQLASVGLERPGALDHICSGQTIVPTIRGVHPFSINSNGIYCIDKPVIYLYPQTPTTVAVKLTIPGTITVSIPHYPTQTGWQNVLAQPDGILTYQGKIYHELYYEDAVKTTIDPTDGIIIPMNNLQDKLSEITGELGLKSSEQQEFLQYWMPKLTALHSNYILFSLLTPQQKDSVDHVDITPHPDTFIEFIAYFKPLDTPIAIQPLILPTTPPKRVGFTAVEWGGTIDQ